MPIAASSGWCLPVAGLSTRTLLRSFVRWVCVIAVVALSVHAPAASAQLLDSVEVTHDGANALIRVKFAALIQYIRHVPANEGSLIQVYFQITAGDEASRTVVEEQRRPNPTDLVPAFTVTYPSQPPGQLRRLDIQFAAPVKFRLRPENASSLLLLIPLSDEQIAKLKPLRPEGVKLPSSTVQATPTNDVERNAAELARDARAALESGDFERAVGLLNRLLNLPPNAWSQEAQEQIGLARERLDETAKAKAEYELYLKLYPDGPGADRIRQRLAALAATPAGVAGAARPGAVTYWGSVSQYYYGGQSRTTTTTIVTPATGATTIDTANLSGIDQSQLANTVDLTTRYRDANWDNRIVVRESYLVNFLKGVGNSNQLNALYAETRYQPAQLMGRFGRQSATTGGVLGLFDGAVASWGLRRQLARRWSSRAAGGVAARRNEENVLRRQRRGREPGRPLERQHVRYPAERIRLRRPYRHRRRAPVLRRVVERLLAARLRSDVSRHEHRDGARQRAVSHGNVAQSAVRLSPHADAAADERAGRRSRFEHRQPRADARPRCDARPCQGGDAGLACRLSRRHAAAVAAMAARRRFPDIVADRDARLRNKSIRACPRRGMSIRTRCRRSRTT